MIPERAPNEDVSPAVQRFLIRKPSGQVGAAATQINVVLNGTGRGQAPRAHREEIVEAGTQVGPYEIFEPAGSGRSTPGKSDNRTSWYWDPLVRLPLPVQPVDATPSDRLIQRYFQQGVGVLGCVRLYLNRVGCL